MNFLTKVIERATRDLRSPWWEGGIKVGSRLGGMIIGGLVGYLIFPSSSSIWWHWVGHITIIFLGLYVGDKIGKNIVRKIKGGVRGV